MLIRCHKLVDDPCDLVIQKLMDGKEMIEQLVLVLPDCNYHISRVKILLNNIFFFLSY
jgi:hypothetical protein